MGRRSKLLESQWEEIGRRLIAGEGVCALARAFKVSPSTISERFKTRVEKVKEVANQIVSAETSLRALSISDQLSAISLADELRSISMHMAGAGRYSAATAHRLSAVAHAKLQALDDADPTAGGGFQEMQVVAALTKMANEASQIPLGLMAANKETVVKVNTEQPKPAALPAAKLSTETLREIVAARNAAA